MQVGGRLLKAVVLSRSHDAVPALLSAPGFPLCPLGWALQVGGVVLLSRDPVGLCGQFVVTFCSRSGLRAAGDRVIPFGHPWCTVGEFEDMRVAQKI